MIWPLGSVVLSRKNNTLPVAAGLTLERKMKNDEKATITWSEFKRFCWIYGGLAFLGGFSVAMWIFA